MLTGTFPYMASTTEELKEMVLNQNFAINTYPYSLLSNGARSFLLKLLCKNPIERYSVEEALKDEWVIEGGIAYDENLRTRVKNRVRRLYSSSSSNISLLDQMYN